MGKGMTPRKGYNHAAYRDNFPFPERKTSQEWCDLHDVFIIDPDGWRGDPDSWSRRITEAEFTTRLNLSTIMHRTPDKAAHPTP